MSADLDLRRKKALYRAEHRGTKEMDWMLGRYAASALTSMAATELTEFEAFLQLPDVDLHQWLVAPGQGADRRFSGLVAAIRAFHKLDEVKRA